MTDWRGKAEAEARRAGLLPKGKLKDLKPGSVWLAVDRYVNLPDSRVGGKDKRKPHPRRHVIVAQAPALNRSKAPKTVLVMPCSASSRAGAWDLDLPYPCDGFSKAAVAFPRLLQPMLKADLEKCTGHVPMEVWITLQALLMSILGIEARPSLVSPRSTP